MRELSPNEMDQVAGGAGENQITLQVIIHTLRVYPGVEFLKSLMKDKNTKRVAKEWLIANLPAYLASRYPGYTLEQIRSIVSAYAMQAINSVI